MLTAAVCASCSSDPDAPPERGDGDGGAFPDGNAPDRSERDGGAADGSPGRDANPEPDADAADDFRCPPAMRAIPAGSFERNDAGITVGPFCLDRTEVTLGSFRACVTAGACDPIPASADERCNSRGTARDGHPADCVTAVQAESFCAWLGKRLPSSDELSWAARGASANAKYPWGSADPTPADDPPRLCWAPISADHTCTTGAFAGGASPQGVFDLAGNVWEWTSTEAGTGNRRVQGGAYWDEAPLALFQADYWEPMPADTAAPAYGFRCAM